jgi:hypothetical protein
VLEGSNNVRLEHDRPSGGSGQQGILVGNEKWPSGTWLENIQIKKQWCTGLRGSRRIQGQLHGAQEAKTDMH